MQFVEGTQVSHITASGSECIRAGRKPAPRGALARLLGDDPRFRQAIELALRAAVTDCSVLILGETGTGKELVARAIHEASLRRHAPMIAVNCGAIPRELIGSELFGHEKGAFTGATGARDGVFVQANQGTLFLDELGELPRDQQPHLLRVLETSVVRRVGGCRERRVDVRLIAATNRIDDELGSALRLDLYHRLATVTVALPPLRKRPGDIPLLVHAFMEEMAPELGEHTISRSTTRQLLRYPWPGNVRELRQAVQRAMTLCPGELTLDQLLPQGSTAGRSPARIRAPRRTRGHGQSARAAYYTPPISCELRPIDRIIRDAFVDAIAESSSLRNAALSLGIARSTFYDWARRLGIEFNEDANDS